MSLATEGSNEGLSEEDKKIIEEEMKNEIEMDASLPESLLVRGALLQCSCGTHCRRLNLPKSYGVYEEDKRHPVVLKKDCVVGDEQNIAYFGVCNSAHKPNTDIICLKPYVWPNGEKSSSKNVTGNKCTPVILDSWFNPQEKYSYTDPETGKKYLSLKTGSFLVCKYGGVIKVQTSGQELEGDETQCQY